jgi:hypothetical protein
MVCFNFIEKPYQQPMLDLRLLKTQILAFAYATTFYTALPEGR